MMICYCCGKGVFALVQGNGYTEAKDEPQQICCRQCSQKVFDIQGSAQRYWKTPDRDKYDGVYMGGWQDTIDKVKAMEICPQCGEVHKKGNE